MNTSAWKEKKLSVYNNKQCKNDNVLSLNSMHYVNLQYADASVIIQWNMIFPIMNSSETLDLKLNKGEFKDINQFKPHSR